MKKLKHNLISYWLPMVVMFIAFTIVIQKRDNRVGQYRQELDTLKARHEFLKRQYEADQQFYQQQFDSLSLILQELTTRKALTESKITEIRERIDAASEDRKKHLLQWQDQ